MACSNQLDSSWLTRAALEALMAGLRAPLVLPELQMVTCCAVWQLAVKARDRQQLIQVGFRG